MAQAVPGGRRTILWVAAGAGALAVAAAIWLLARPGHPSSPARQAELGEEVLDAGFAFVVREGKCGYVNVVSPSRTLPAEGTICLVSADVTNEGEESRSLNPGCQFLIDPSGHRFNQREDAWRLDEFSVAAFDHPIPAGSLVENVGFYYDAPQGIEADAIELHGDCDSPGVLVEL